MTLFGDPTVNAYARFRPYSFAPDRIGWAFDNRGALIRIQGGPGDAEHARREPHERAGREPVPLARRQHRRRASTASSGAPRRRRSIVGDPYAEEADLLPQSLGEAADALDCQRSSTAPQFGDALVDYLVMMKRAEVARYTRGAAPTPAARSEWEMREYFEIY